MPLEGATFGSQRFGSSTSSAGRGHQCEGQFDGSLACLPQCVPQAVEGLHRHIPGAGEGVPRADRLSSRGCEQGQGRLRGQADRRRPRNLRRRGRHGGECIKTHIRGLHLARDPPWDLETGCLQTFADGPPSDMLRAVLVDVEMERPQPIERRVRWIQHKITRQSLIRILHLHSLCWWVTDECTVWQNGYQLEPLDLFDGDHLKIKIVLNLEPNDVQCDNLLSDQVSLLQQTIVETWRSTGTFDAVDPELCPCERRNMLPSGPLPDLQRGEILDLRRIERARHAVLRARRSGSSNRPVSFHTWFLSSIGCPRCEASRIANLDADSTTWNTQIQRLWQDRFDPHWPFRLVLVDPPVEPAQDGGHLLVVQHEHQQERASLLSLFWHDDATALWSRTAHLLPQLLSFDQLLA